MIVVASILEKGDIIIMDTGMYKVLYCDEDEVCVRHLNKGRYLDSARQISIGRKSKKKLILVEDCDWGELQYFPNIFTKPSQ